MQLKSIIRPAALFAVGGLASGANAAAVDIAATDAGTNIYLFGSQTAQFTYDFDVQAAGTANAGQTKYYLRSAPGTRNVIESSSTPNAQTSDFLYNSQAFLFYTQGSGSGSTYNGKAGFRITDSAGVVRYGQITSNIQTRRITDISINGVADFYVGTTPQQVAGVPEPATWATAVIGLGLAGAAMRRRRREGTRQPAALAA